MHDGPGEMTLSMAPTPYDTDVHVLDAGPHRMVRESKKILEVEVPHRFTDHDIELIITSRESGGRERTWSSRHLLVV